MVVCKTSSDGFNSHPGHLALTFMLTLSFLINDLTNPPLTTANTSQVTELVDIFFVSTILTLFIALSLVLTFHINGTTVHKVLGLLLVSIFVVFL